jgi:5-methylcytosine-specific restriction protein A
LCKLEGKLVPATVTHHLTPLSKGGSNRADNLVPLCEDCHGRLHGKHGEELKAKLEREKPSKTERWSFF